MNTNYVEQFRKFIKTERTRVYHDGIEIFYYQDVNDMLAAIAEQITSTPKEPETVHGNEAEKGECQCISIIGLIKGPNGEKICKSCKKIRR
jgi:flavorubredoxin